MGGVGRLGVLAVESPDPILSVVAPIGLAAAAGTGLVVDLAGGLRVESQRTLGDLIDNGPSRSELSPGRSGVAVLSGHLAERAEALAMVESLAASWPAVVLRCDAQPVPFPRVPVRPLYPGLLSTTDVTPAVWQPITGLTRPPGPGPVLPRLTASLARRLLLGRLPSRSRWMSSWKHVWELPWA